MKRHARPEWMQWQRPTVYTEDVGSVHMLPRAYQIAQKLEAERARLDLPAMHTWVEQDGIKIKVRTSQFGWAIRLEGVLPGGPWWSHGLTNEAGTAAPFLYTIPRFVAGSPTFAHTAWPESAIVPALPQRGSPDQPFYNIQDIILDQPIFYTPVGMDGVNLSVGLRLVPGPNPEDPYTGGMFQVSAQTLSGLSTETRVFNEYALSAPVDAVFGFMSQYRIPYDTKYQGTRANWIGQVSDGGGTLAPRIHYLGFDTATGLAATPIIDTIAGVTDAGFASGAQGSNFWSTPNAADYDGSRRLVNLSWNNYAVASTIIHAGVPFDQFTQYAHASLQVDGTEAQGLTTASTFTFHPLNPYPQGSYLYYPTSGVVTPGGYQAAGFLTLLDQASAVSAVTFSVHQVRMTDTGTTTTHYAALDVDSSTLPYTSAASGFGGSSARSPDGTKHVLVNYTELAPAGAGGFFGPTTVIRSIIANGVVDDIIRTGVGRTISHVTRPLGDIWAHSMCAIVDDGVSVVASPRLPANDTLTDTFPAITFRIYDNAGVLKGEMVRTSGLLALASMCEFVLQGTAGAYLLTSSDNNKVYQFRFTIDQVTGEFAAETDANGDWHNESTLACVVPPFTARSTGSYLALARPVGALGTPPGPAPTTHMWDDGTTFWDDGSVFWDLS